MQTGLLTWKVRPKEDFPSDWSWKVWNKRFPGTVAGWNGDQGYKMVKLFGRQYQVHRIIWLIENGSLPSMVDHINGDRSDNRIINLREVTITENNRNAKLRKDNKSGYVGVTWCKRKKKWRAQICVDGRDIHLGVFSDIKLAVKARLSAQKEYGFHRNHGRAA